MKRKDLKIGTRFEYVTGGLQTYIAGRMGFKYPLEHLDVEEESGSVYRGEDVFLDEEVVVIEESRA